MVRKNPKRRKLDELGKAVVVDEESKTVWQITNKPKHNISNETIKLLFTFGHANKTTIRNQSDEYD